MLRGVSTCLRQMSSEESKRSFDGINESLEVSDINTTAWIVFLYHDSRVAYLKVRTDPSSTAEFREKVAGRV